MKKLFGVAAATLFAIATAQTAQAAPSYCNPTANLDNTVNVNQVSFRGSASDGCYGLVTGNDSLSDVNTIFSGGWDASVKDETDTLADPGGNTLVGYKGANWTLDSQGGNTDRSWSLTVTPAINPAIFVDLLVVLKGSNEWAAYLFNSESFGSGGTGVFTVPFTNPGNGSLQNLSHMTVYFRDGSEGCPPTANIPGCLPPGDTPVPEPATLALLGLGLLGAGVARRRKQ